MDNSREVTILDHKNQSKRTYSFQDLQAIYHELTGKKESMSELIPSCIKLNVEHVEQLNHKIMQWIEQYNCVATNSSVTVRTVDGQKNVSSDVERFLLSPNPTTSETLSISIEYQFMILLPAQQSVQNYKLSIQLDSNIAKVHKMKKESISLPNFFIVISNTIAGQVEIEYVDFNVADSLMTLVKNWTKAVSAPKSKSAENYKKYQKYSRFIPSVFTFSSVCLILFIAFFMANDIIILGELVNSFKNIILFIIAMLVAGVFSYFIGTFTESSYDKRILISYIELNNHDKELIDQTLIENTQTKKDFYFSMVVNFIISIGAGIVTTLLMAS